MTAERIVAGHRVLRLLADGRRSQVWLGAGDVALKVLTHPVPASQPGREAEALHRARGDHVVELLDVSVGRAGAVLVFPRLPRGSLADVLVRRTALDAGESVTMLAPIAASMARMHAAGVAHTALEPGCVLFRRDGAPMLTGFGAAELFQPGLAEIELERIAGVSADRAALLRLADAVLSRTTGERAAVAARLRDEVHAIPPDRLAVQLAASLFELAAARPIRFDAATARDDDRTGRAIPVREPVVTAGADGKVGGSSAELGIGGRAGEFAARVDRVLASGPGQLLRTAARERWRGWSAGRRRAVLATATAVLVLIIAIAVVPGPEVPEVDAAVVPAPTGPSDGPGVSAMTSDDAVIAGEDPVAALQALVERRERCFRELSMLCLEGVDESGSSALDSDRSALHAVLDGGIAMGDLLVSDPVVIERLGGSALVGLGPDSDPASVLLLKGETGWRIRDYIAAAGSESG